jgi:DNA-binding beta-propeller fold protein YncE
MTVTLSQRALRAAAVLAALAPALLAAQQFKVEKANIGGEGGTDYVSVDNATGRVYVSRATHVMAVDGATMKVVCDIPDTPRVHGVGVDQKAGRGFTTNAGDSTVTVFALKDCSFIRKIKVASGGLDGIMYDAADDRIILTNHSRPTGTVTVIDPNAMEVVGTVELEDIAPEGAAADGKGHLFVNNEGKSTIQVVDLRTMKTTASWPLAPCEGPTGIAYDKATNRIFSGCSNTSVVLDASTGKVVARIANGDGVDALGWDASQKLIYIPAGRAGNVTVVHQDAPDKYTVVATVATVPGAKTICVDDRTHAAYLFQPEYGPAPQPDPNASAAGAAGGGGRGGRGGSRGPMVAAWFIKITR